MFPFVLRLFAVKGSFEFCLFFLPVLCWLFFASSSLQTYALLLLEQSRLDEADVFVRAAVQTELTNPLSRVIEVGLDVGGVGDSLKTLMRIRTCSHFFLCACSLSIIYHLCAQGLFQFANEEDEEADTAYALAQQHFMQYLQQPQQPLLQQLHLPLAADETVFVFAARLALHLRLATCAQRILDKV